MCSAVGSCWLSVSNIAVCSSKHQFILCFYLSVHLYQFFLDSTYKGCHRILLLLSDWLHSVWRSLGPSMLLQMALLFHVFNGWVRFHGINSNMVYFDVLFLGSVYVFVLYICPFLWEETMLQTLFCVYVFFHKTLYHLPISFALKKWFTASVFPNIFSVTTHCAIICLTH